VTAEELARRHPRLFHVTAPGVGDRLGHETLMSTTALLARLGVAEAERLELTRKRRASEVSIQHPNHGVTVLNDNRPLSEKKLAMCLDDGLSPADWLAMLNDRVFFWADEKGLARLATAKMNCGRRREVLVFDTLPLILANFDRAEISPINSGATIHRPARRGHSTFAPLSGLDYDQWRRRRGQRDKVVEVVVRTAVADAAKYLIERREIGS
jgi:hypothetical protein